MVIHRNDINFTLKEKVIKYLLENKNSPLSIREISKNLKTDYKNTFNAIKDIKSLISIEKLGNINLINLKLVPGEEIYEVENKRRTEFIDKHKNLSIILEDVKSLNYPFLIVLIFGSYVKKTEIKKSDIDICIISDSNEKIKELISKLNLIPLPLGIQEFSFNEFESMLKTKENNLSDEIIKNNIILYGIENYYNLISKWMKKE